MFYKDEQIKKQVNQSSRIVVSNIGENVRYLRKKNKLSRSKFLKNLLDWYGIKMSYNNLVLLEWSKSKCNIELKTISVLSVFFNVPIDSLMFLNYSLNEDFERVRESEQ